MHHFPQVQDLHLGGKVAVTMENDTLWLSQSETPEKRYVCIIIMYSMCNFMHYVLVKLIALHKFR